jgi:hypothetical protein
VAILDEECEGSEIQTGPRRLATASEKSNMLGRSRDTALVAAAKAFLAQSPVGNFGVPRPALLGILGLAPPKWISLVVLTIADYGTRAPAVAQHTALKAVRAGDDAAARTWRRVAALALEPLDADPENQKIWLMIN